MNTLFECIYNDLSENSFNCDEYLCESSLSDPAPQYVIDTLKYIGVPDNRLRNLKIKDVESITLRYRPKPKDGKKFVKFNTMATKLYFGCKEFRNTQIGKEVQRTMIHGITAQHMLQQHMQNQQQMMMLHQQVHNQNLMIHDQIVNQNNIMMQTPGMGYM